VRMRRAPRVLLAGAAAVLALAGVAGCRTSPSVAAYVGDQQISVEQLQAAVDDRLQDADVAAFAKGHEDTFTRQVLSLLVGEDVYAAAAQRWHVTVTDGEVRDRIATLIGNNDPATVYAQLAAQGIGRADVFENVRQQLIRQKVARTEGLADGVSEESLRRQYDQTRDQHKQFRLGYVTVPDQPTADAVLAQLTADPGSYPQVAAAFPGDATLATIQTRAADQLPSALAEQVQKAQPGTGFTLPVQGLGVVVAFVADITYPSFEELRPSLENAAASDVDAAAQKLIKDFRAGLDITVNPRYGVLQENAVVPAQGGVVDILGGESSGGAGTGPAGAPATGSTGG
jgi:SurA N-terminal domain/PPIC-type PPIASE domain